MRFKKEDEGATKLILDTVRAIGGITTALEKNTNILAKEVKARHKLEERVNILTECVVELREENIRLKNIINDKL